MFKHTFGNNNISRKLVLAILFSILLAFLTVGGIYLLLERRLSIFFIKTFEAKSLAQLESYHEGKVTDTKDLFEHIFNVAKRFSQDQSFTGALKSGDFGKAKELLQRQRLINQHLESWYVFDKTGKLIAVSSAKPELEAAIGRNFGTRDYFQAVMKTGKPYISQQLTGVVTRSLFIGFSVPIMNEKKEVIYVLTGSTTLNALQEELELKTHFSYNYNTFVDWDFDILYENGRVLSRQISLKDLDRIVTHLSKSDKRLIEEELNYKNERVIAMGDRLQFGPNKESTYYLISYFIKSEFDKQLGELKQEIRRIFTGIIVLVSFVMIAAWCLNIWLIKLFINNKRISIEWKNLVRKLLR